MRETHLGLVLKWELSGFRVHRGAFGAGGAWGAGTDASVPGVWDGSAGCSGSGHNCTTTTAQPQG